MTVRVYGLSKTGETTEVVLRNAPKFSVGDRVTDKGVTGVVKEIVPDYHYRLELGDEQHSLVVQRGEDGLSYARLTEEEAWLETSLLVGADVGNAGVPLREGEKTEIRHKSYQVLGGSGIKITEPVKQRVSSLIERAEKIAAS